MDQAGTGRLIADCRKGKGLTQAQLAEKLNITDRAVSKWETGKSMPDASVMLELCQILGVSANELLSGEKNEINNHKEADEALLKFKRKNECSIHKNAAASVIFSAIMIAGIMVCCICDIAITGAFTWSLIALSAVIFAWIISFPVVLLGKRGSLGGMLSLSIFTIPFLYIIGVLTKRMAVFRIGSIMSVLTFIYMWVIYALYIRLGNRKMLATGITFFLAIPFMFLVNMALSKMIAEPVLDIWDILSALILLAAGLSFVFGDCVRNRGRIRRSGLVQKD